MIDPDKRKAIFLLHREGMAAREISRRLKLDYKTVLVIIQQQGVMPHSTRSDKQVLDEALLRRLYQECSGWMARALLGRNSQRPVGACVCVCLSGVAQHQWLRSLFLRCGRTQPEPWKRS